jgi:DeoR/GlpR family transcriptional regulator of sugar metabolism
MADRDARSFAPERQARILRALDGDGSVVSAQLAAQLGVSIDTVRRDLAELEVAGALRRVHGGAVRPPPTRARGASPTASSRTRPRRGSSPGLAVGLVGAGQVVALGGGTTTLLLARALPRDLEATVVTASPDVALALRDHPGIDVDLLGGRLHRVSQTVTGADTVEQVRALRLDLCVMSTCGLDPEAGVTMREREEALVVRAMLERSARAVVLASADKLGAAGAYVVAQAGDVDALVTDAPRRRLGAYEDLGIVLVTPDGPSLHAVAAGA